MSYTKTNWQNDTAPAINATNLNKIEQGIFDNDSNISNVNETLGVDTNTWEGTTAYGEGDVVIYNNKIYQNITGTSTITNPEEDTTNWEDITIIDNVKINSSLLPIKNTFSSSPNEIYSSSFINDLLNTIFPVGKTEIFYDNLDHSNYLGFTWERISAGRTLVGYDANDSDFNNIGNYGGSKTHQHRLPIFNFNASSADGPRWTNWNGAQYGLSPTYENIKTGAYGDLNPSGIAGQAGGYPYLSSSESTLQPYLVVAIWKRVS